jgi:DNA-binding beta-propeller fold protein YncE
MFSCVLLRLAFALLPAAAAAEAPSPPLLLETKIALGEVGGRIDHLGVDVPRRRLFVAELGNSSLGVVDLAAGKVMRTIAGMSEPQGVAYVPFADNIYVANGGDGSVRILRGEDFAPAGRIELGNDADNVRIDMQRRRVLVGYGKGTIAAIDPADRTKTAEIRLKAHPEGFQIDATAGRVFVNVPDARDIEVADLGGGAQRSWPTQGLSANFPMAIDPESHRVLVVFRSPPTLAAYNADGTAAARIETCGDADDLFVDAKRRRVYVSCGEGLVEVFEQADARYRRLAQIPTVSGARTSLFVPDLDRFFVAARARSGEPAALWVFRPGP